VWSDYCLSGREDLVISSLHGKDARKVLLFIGVMTVHSLAEGIGMGMSFGGGLSLGFSINIAMAIHNLPEGITVALVLVSKGVSPLSATVSQKSGFGRILVTLFQLWATFSALPQPLMAIPSYWFVEVFSAILPFGLSFSAGAMVSHLRPSLLS
jgi:zinc transporter, ZIP family